ncbi:MAG TPA: hypothetical protein PKJ41_19035 [Bryobacteraceae bacterium]|nr:hypothetical protein [Bryobacteraceae bacterium]
MAACRRMTGTQIGVLVVAVVLGYLATSSWYVGTRFCPKWWERFIVDRRTR